MGCRAGPRKAAASFIDWLGVSGFETASPRSFSGGMTQRTATRARRLRSENLLMDEPFGALDAQTRSLMQASCSASGSGTPEDDLRHPHVQEAVYLADGWRSCRASRAHQGDRRHQVRQERSHIFKNNAFVEKVDEI